MNSSNHYRVRNLLVVLSFVCLTDCGGGSGSTLTSPARPESLGCAQISFGDSAGTLTTATLPVFLYYSIVSNATGQPLPALPQQGIFGVNSVTNLISVPGSTEPADGYPLCTSKTSGSCRTVSVFKYVQYPPGINDRNADG